MNADRACGYHERWLQEERIEMFRALRAGDSLDRIAQDAGLRMQVHMEVFGKLLEGKRVGGVDVASDLQGLQHRK